LKPQDASSRRPRQARVPSHSDSGTRDTIDEPFDYLLTKQRGVYDDTAVIPCAKRSRKRFDRVPLNNNVPRDRAPHVGRKIIGEQYDQAHTTSSHRIASHRIASHRIASHRIATRLSTVALMASVPG
jgi:hypothetical protein